MTDKNKIDYLEVKKYLPHRYPFLLVDTVDSYEINKWLKAIKR